MVEPDEDDAADERAEVLMLLAAPTAGGDPERAAARASQRVYVDVVGPVGASRRPPGSVCVGGVVFAISGVGGETVRAEQRERVRSSLEADLPPSGWGAESSAEDRRWAARKRIQRIGELARLRRVMDER